MARKMTSAVHDVVSRHRRTWAALGLALLVVAGCGGSDYKYVANREHGNFFKVPTAWHLQNVTEVDREGRPEELPGGIVSIWHTVFDNAPSGGLPTLDAEQLPEQVTGSAEIYAISDSYREQFSMSKIREMAFGGVDPVFAPDELSPKIRLVTPGYTPLEGGDLNGSRVVANMDLAEEGATPRWMTVDVSMLFDNRTGRIFLLRMQCASACYEQNRAAVDEIAASWTVKPS